MNSLIKLNNLNFGYSDRLVLKDVSFTVNKGDFLGIIGANGSGKSTLIKLMLKLLIPLSGEITLFGEDINSFRKWNRLGYVSQKANSFNGNFPATVEEVVMANLYSKIGLFRFPSKQHKEKVYQALERVGMSDYGNRLIGNLSGGQQQRVFIARVLASEPEILFLDEPTVGIDAKSEEAVYSLLARLNKELGLTVVMVTHDIGAITAHADRIICLGEKDVIEHKLEESKRKEFASEIYGYGVKMHLHDCKDCCRSEVICRKEVV